MCCHPLPTAANERQWMQASGLGSQPGRGLLNNHTKKTIIFSKPF
jgi:hypothetical protein